MPNRAQTWRILQKDKNGTFQKQGVHNQRIAMSIRVVDRTFVDFFYAFR